jgi:NADH-quinone oxidoreductase subunit N
MGVSMPSSNCMDLWAVVPEMLLAALTLALVPVAAFARGRWQSLPALAAAAGLAASMALSARMWNHPAAAAFCGTWAVDRLAVLYKLLIEGGALLSLLMLSSHFRGRSAQAHAPLPLLFATVGGLGLASSVDLALILLFLQILSIASYLLVLLERTDRQAQEATLKYFIYAGSALAIMAYGLTFLYGLTGSLDLPGIARGLEHADPAWVLVAAGIILVGYGFEITSVPFQFWAPDVYQGASAPAAGFISVVPKIAAFAALLRFLVEALPAYSAQWSLLIGVLAVGTMTLGNLAALRQSRLKRLLAYSSIAQAGYMLMGVAVAIRSPGGVPAVSFYLLAYLAMNLGAFAVIGVLELHAGNDARDIISGLARRAPWLAAVLTLALLSLAGIPPLAGFSGKWLLLTQAIDGGMAWLAVVGAINMTVGLYYYVRIIADMFMGPTSQKAQQPLRIRISAGYAAAAAIATVGTVALGIAPESVISATVVAGWLR